MENEDKLANIAATHIAASLSKDTQRAYASTIRKLTAFFGKDKLLSDVTPNDARAWCEWLHKQPIKATTGNFYRRTARSLFRQAERPDLASALVNRGELPRTDRAITDHDLALIVAHANTRDTAIVLLLAESGCRRGTIPRLRVDRMVIWEPVPGDLRFAAETLEKGTGGGEPRFVYARRKTSLAVMLWLETRPFDSEYLFNSMTTGEQLEPNSVSLMFKRLKMKAGIPKDHNVFAHAHRHRFAQKALDEHDAKIVSQLMGHKSVTTTLDIYGHRSAESLAKAFFGDDNIKLPTKDHRAISNNLIQKKSGDSPVNGQLHSHTSPGESPD